MEIQKDGKNYRLVGILDSNPIKCVFEIKFKGIWKPIKNWQIKIELHKEVLKGLH